MSDPLPELLGNVERLLADLVPQLVEAMLAPLAATPKGREDYVTELDLRAHRQICAGLADLTPGVAVDSEEGQVAGTEPDVRWVVDPIDGSQNVAFGLPIAGSTLCLVRGGRVVLAAAARLWPGRVLGACDGVAPRASAVGDRLRTGEPVHPAREPANRVSLLRGAADNRAEFLRAQHVLSEAFDRVYQTRCPVVDLFLLLEGGCKAFVCVGLTGHETLPVIDLARRLGFTIHDASGTRIPPWAVPELMIIAREGDIPPLRAILGW